MQRHISLDVYDYAGHALCNLYDSNLNVSGQATDVIIHTERNGFKEIKFKLPSICTDEEGESKNYRLDYLVNDYRLRFFEEKWDDTNDIVTNRTSEIDWFLISESKVTHANFSTDFEIRAGHISQLLNTKNLNLEFSEDEGNNVGTIRQLAETILQGTGWTLGYVAEFKEEDKYNLAGKEKVRTLNASSRTGAFKLMSELCELFDAKPIYHGEGRVVDIIPMNPFSEKLEDGAVPPDMDRDKVLELYYDKNIKSITRTLNTDNLVTVLYAYGSYGDRNGLASLQMAEHAEIAFGALEPGEYRFEYQNAKYYFTTDIQTTGLKWSSLDPVSRSYVYDGEHLFKVYKKPNGTPTVLTVTPTYVKNQLSYIMDFSYYEKIGLLNDDMLLALAEAQAELPSKHIAAQEASISLANVQEQLSRTASAGSGFAMLDISDSDIDDGYVKLTLNKTTYEDGVIFRSDYDEAKRNYFSWNTASQIKDNGEAIAGKGAVVYIVHEGNPTKWEKSYVKALGNLTNNYYRDSLGNIYNIHDESHYANYDAFPAIGSTDIIYVADDTRHLYCWVVDAYVEIQASGYFYGLNEFDFPDTITLWTSNDTWHAGDKVYLFSSDSIAGLFGPREDAIMSNRKSIEEATKVSTETHPLYFINDDDVLPSVDACLNSYGWCYRSYTSQFELGDLYFCWGVNGDLEWRSVLIDYGDNIPTIEDQINNTYLTPRIPVGSTSSTPQLYYPYVYSIKRMMLYILQGEEYIAVNKTVNEEKITSNFSAVIDGCINQEYLTKGVYERYNSYAALEAGKNYAIKNEYNNYWLFTATMNVPTPPANHYVPYVHYIPATKILWQDDDENHIVKAIEHSFRHLDFPKKNELEDAIWDNGSYANGVFSTEGNQYISNNIYVHDNTVYEFGLDDSIVVCLDENQRVLGEFQNSPFTTPNHTTHVRIVSNSEPYEAGESKNLLDPDEMEVEGLPLGTYTFSAEALSGYSGPVMYTWYYGSQPRHSSLPAANVGERVSFTFTVSADTSLRFLASPTLGNCQLEAGDEATSYASYSMYFRVKDYDKVFFSSNKQYYIISATGVGERLGINYLMDQFIALAHEAYEVKLPALRAAQQEITDINLNLAETLGDMYREGYWQENNYVEGDEDKLYSDAMDNLKEISHPQATYEISYLELYRNNELVEDGIETDYPDIDITYAAHLVDPDIDTNRWAYIDSIDKCYDQRWKTTLEINTQLSMIGQQSFTDVLAKIAEVANETKAKQTIYEKASAISNSGQFAAEKLEGAIQANKIYLTGGTSNWYTDSKGNIIFESADGNSAMMLTGRGLMVANSKDQYSDWDWRTALSGEGFNADTIATGEFSAKHILAGSITTDKLSANVGEELELGSNRSLVAYATVDGERPAGALKTTDALIEIKAGNDTDPAEINVLSGGVMNLKAGTEEEAGGILNIESNGELNINGGVLNLSSEGKINITAGTTLDIRADSNFIVDSDNFKIQHNEVTDKYDVIVNGDITATSGRIAGFTIGSNNDKYYLFAGNTHNMSATANGIYLGSDGINLGGKFTVTPAGKLKATDAEISGKITSSEGQIGAFTLTNALYTNNKNTINTDVLGVYIGSNGIGLGKTAIIDGDTVSAFQVNNNGMLYAYGAHIIGTIEAEDGHIGGWNINETSITSNQTGLAVTSADSDVAFWAGSNDPSEAKFTVAQNGKLIAKDATIVGTISASNGTIAGWQIDVSRIIGNKTGIAKTTNDSDVAFWAGNNNPLQATFTVTQDGALYASNADIKGKISATQLYIGSQRANISLDDNGRISASSIGDLSGNYATIENVNGLINAMSLDSIGNGTSVSITPQGLTVNSNGTVDLSAAKSINLGSKTISMSSIKDAPDMNGYYQKASGINISEDGVDITGDQYVKIGTTNNDHVWITDNGIEIKGGRVNILDANNNVCPLWGRDDIIVMNPNSSVDWRKSVDSIESHMSKKHDWVLIRPFYDIKKKYSGSTGKVTTNIQGKYTQDGSIAFGNNSEWYNYGIALTITNSGNTLYTNRTVKVFLSNRAFSFYTEYHESEAQAQASVVLSSSSFTIPQSGTVVVSEISNNIGTKINSGHISTNLCQENSNIYFYIYGLPSDSNVKIKVHTLMATNSSTSDKVACTVYYYK